MKLLRLFAAGLSRSAQATLTFRVNLLFDIVLSIIGLFATLATVFIVYSRTDSLAGWTEAETYVLFGTFQLLSSLKNAFIDPNLSWFPENGIRKGNLDTVLLQPAPTSTSRAWDDPPPSPSSSSSSDLPSSRSGSVTTDDYQHPSRPSPGC